MYTVSNPVFASLDGCGHSSPSARRRSRSVSSTYNPPLVQGFIDTGTVMVVGLLYLTDRRSHGRVRSEWRDGPPDGRLHQLQEKRRGVRCCSSALGTVIPDQLGKWFPRLRVDHSGCDFVPVLLERLQSCEVLPMLVGGWSAAPGYRPIDPDDWAQGDHRGSQASHPSLAGVVGDAKISPDRQPAELSSPANHQYFEIRGLLEPEHDRRWRTTTYRVNRVRMQGPIDS